MKKTSILVHWHFLFKKNPIIYNEIFISKLLLFLYKNNQYSEYTPHYSSIYCGPTFTNSSRNSPKDGPSNHALFR